MNNPEYIEQFLSKLASQSQFQVEEIQKVFSLQESKDKGELDFSVHTVLTPLDYELKLEQHVLIASNER